MKIIVAQKNIKKALSVVERMVSRNTTLPILQNIVLKTEQGRLRISATNLEVGIHYTIGAKIEEVGEIAVPGRILSDVVNTINEDTILLTTKNNSLFINSKNYKTQILGFSTHEYPLIPKISEEVITSIPAKMLKNSLAMVMDSMAVSESRPELSGVYMQCLPQKILFTATDIFRLAEKSLTIPCKKKVGIILPRNTVTELVRICGEIDDDVTLRVGMNQVAFMGSDFEFVSRLIDGNYPDYAKVIPETTIARVLVAREDLEKNTRLAGLFSSSISDIKISCEKDKIKLVAQNSDRGEVQALIEAVLKGEPFEVLLNFHYLADGLKSIISDKVVIEFTGPGSPLVLRPADDAKDFLYLIMPLRT